MRQDEGERVGMSKGKVVSYYLRNWEGVRVGSQ